MDEHIELFLGVIMVNYYILPLINWWIYVELCFWIGHDKLNRSIMYVQFFFLLL